MLVPRAMATSARAVAVLVTVDIAVSCPDPLSTQNVLASRSKSRRCSVRRLPPAGFNSWRARPTSCSPETRVTVRSRIPAWRTATS
jgi:hypothetical protein